MDRESSFPGRAAIILPVKDALRGTRAILRQAGRALTPSDLPLPSPLRGTRRCPDGFASRVETLAFEVATQLASVCTVEARHDFERGPTAFARAYLEGMTFALDRLGSSSLLISETLAAGAYWSGLRKLQDGHRAEHLAARLYRSLSRHHVAGMAPGTPFGLAEADLQQTRLATFATLMWLLVKREEPQANEDEILGLCLDVTLSLADEVSGKAERVEADPGPLAALMASYADVI